MDQQSVPKLTPEFLEQHPLVSLALMAFTLVMFLFLVGVLTSWGFLIVRAAQGKPILSPEPWKPRVWGFVDIIVAVFLIIFWQRQSAIVGCNLLGLDRQEISASQVIPLPLATILGLGNVAALLTICLWIVLRHRASLAQLGFACSRCWKHLSMGVIAAFASIPLVYALMAAVSYSFDNKYSHPLLDEMKREGSLTAYLLAVTSAVLIAPLVEEFLFRVLIQGWLQSAPFGTLKSIFLGERELTGDALAVNSSSPSGMDATVHAQLLDASTPPQIMVSDADASSAMPSSTMTDNANWGTGTHSATSRLPEAGPVAIPPIWPSFVTGTLFGLAHYGYGLSFIPLIILGVILGLLYRATHSIWPSLVVHCILNGNSMLMLGISILLEQVSK